MGARRLPAALALGTVLALGLALRACNLAHVPLWVDEAESCINALTVLEGGVPRSTYQGQPIYENVLTRRWPESAEYEFADTSYSPRGYAVYHGWLPLYAIAGAYAAAGIRPDPVPARLEVRHDREAMRARTVAGRAPSVAFGALLLLLLFLAGRQMHSPAAGWAALVGGALARPLVVYARQARYYSATVALAVACLLALWRMLRLGRWRDVVLCALAYAALFHTHMLSFAVACGTLLLALPLARPAPRRSAKAALFAGIVAAATLPWMLWTGYFRSASEVPKAWRLLDLPGDLLDYPRAKPLFALLLAASVLGLLGARLLRARLAPDVRAAWCGHRGSAWVLCAWIALAFLGFTFAMPAASYFIQRLTLVIAGPALLLGAIAVAAAAQVLAPRFAAPVAAAGAVGLAAALGGLSYPWIGGPERISPATQAVEHLRQQGPLPVGTRVYATPNEHLTLALYSGMPVQSVAPVRAEFLDRHPGPLVVIEAVSRFEPVPWPRLREALIGRLGAVDEAQIDALHERLSTRLVREQLLGRAAEVEPPLLPLPEYAVALLDLQRGATRLRVRELRSPDRDNPAMFRGVELEDWAGWWPWFFYRFVDPASRSGPHLNYARRVRDARAVVLGSSWVVFHCPPLPPQRAGGPTAGERE